MNMDHREIKLENLIAYGSKAAIVQNLKECRLQSGNN